MSRVLPLNPSKNLPAFLAPLIRPALFLSIGLHGLLLLLPLPSRQQSPAPAETAAETSVTVTQFPRAAPAPSAAPRPSLAPAPTPPKQPPAPLPRPATVSVPPSPASAPAVVSSPAPAPSPAASPAAAPPAPVTRLETPFADFPDVAGAEAGCFNTETCRQLQGQNFRAASQTLQNQLEAQGYGVRWRGDLEETGRAVYEVSQAGQTRYLSVLSTDLGTAVYVLAAQPVGLSDLQQVETVKSNLQATLDRLAGATPAIVSQFSHPELFWQGTSPRPDIAEPFRWVSGSNPAQLSATLQALLQASGFSYSSIGEYGGGSVYEVNQGAFTGYLNLVPAQDGTGTILVLWSSLPG